MNAVVPLQAEDGPLVALDLEQQVIGGILANNATFQRIQAFLQPEHFGDARHAEIYACAKAMMEAGKPATPPALASYMAATDSLAAIGGAAYLARIITGLTSPAFVEDYARMLLDLAVRRQALVQLRTTGDLLKRADFSAAASGLLAQAATALDELASAGTAPMAVSVGDAAADAVNATTDIVTHGVVPAIVPTGFEDLDRIMDGFDPGSYTIIGARPSMGKTSLAQWVAYNAANAGFGVAFFSIEMAQRRLTERWLSGLSGIPASAIKTGRISEGQLKRPLNEREMQKLEEAREQIASLPIALDLNPRPTVPDIIAGIRKMRREKKPVDLVVVDYLGLVRCAERMRSRYEEVTQISADLKAAAKTLNLPFVVLAQLSRANEGRDDKRPSLSDLRDSGAIEQDADIVMFLHREHYYLARNPPKRRTGEEDPDFANRVSDYETDCATHAGKAELNIAKNRNGGLGLVDLAFTDHLTRFSSLARGEQR